MKLMRKSLSNQIYTVLKKEILHGADPVRFQARQQTAAEPF